MALTNYCDYMLFRKAETLWNIFPLKVPPTQTHITPTLTYSQYHDTLVNVYNTGLTEDEIVVADYRTKCLADFVTGVTAGGVHVTGATIDCYTDIATYTNSSGGTFTLDLSCVGDLGGFWSASSVDGTFIVNSGTTDAGANPNKVGIGTLIPSHELAVSGTASASTSLLSPIISAQTGIIAGNLGVSGETQVAGTLNLGIVDANSANITRIANTGTNVLGGSVVYNAGLGTGTGPPGSHIWYGGDKGTSGSVQHSNIGLMLLNSFGMSDDVTTLRLYSVASTSDAFEIGVDAAGLTTLSTTDSGGATADLILSPDGQVRVDVGLVVTGNTVMNGTLSATTSCKVGNGDGFISAATIDGPTISADTLYIKNKTVTSASDIGILVGIAADDKVYTATTATLGVGVSSVNTQVPSTSTGDILSISPTTGGVVIEPHVYGGGSNIGAVPSGGAAGQYLDGNLGVWTTLPAGGDSYWSASTGQADTIVNSGLTSYVGIGTDTPGTKLDVHHNPTGLADNTGGGEVVTFGTEHGTDTLAAGKLMYLNPSGVWRYADADVSKGNDELLAIALGTTVAEGLLIRGFFDQVAELSDTFVKGGVCYVGTPAGEIQFTQPSGSGDYVRVVGYGTDTANVIYFNPDGTYITVA